MASAAAELIKTLDNSSNTNAAASANDKPETPLTAAGVPTVAVTDAATASAGATSNTNTAAGAASGTNAKTEAALAAAVSTTIDIAPVPAAPSDKVSSSNASSTIDQKTIDKIKAKIKQVNDRRNFEQFLKNNTETLTLAGCELDDTDVKVICDLIETDKKIKILNLSHNNISDNGARYLAALLKKKSVLEVLNLYGNFIQETGAKALAEALDDTAVRKNVVEKTSANASAGTGTGAANASAGVVMATGAGAAIAIDSGSAKTASDASAGAQTTADASAGAKTAADVSKATAHTVPQTLALNSNVTLEKLNLGANYIGLTGVEFITKARQSKKLELRLHDSWLKLDQLDTLAQQVKGNATVTVIIQQNFKKMFEQFKKYIALPSKKLDIMKIQLDCLPIARSIKDKINATFDLLQSLTLQHLEKWNEKLVEINKLIDDEYIDAEDANVRKLADEMIQSLKAYIETNEKALQISSITDVSKVAKSTAGWLASAGGFLPGNILSKMVGGNKPSKLTDARYIRCRLALPINIASFKEILGDYEKLETAAGGGKEIFGLISRYKDAITAMEKATVPAPAATAAGAPVTAVAAVTPAPTPPAAAKH